MKWFITFRMLIIQSVVTFLLASACGKDTANTQEEVVTTDDGLAVSNPEPTVDEATYKLPNIDLNNWKVTLPVAKENGKPLEVAPPEIVDYAIDERLLPFMYNDSTDGALVFYTFPGASTANSSYSRTELREQMEPGSNTTNWTFAEGGEMEGTLAVPEISEDANGKPYRTIVMQIHGRLTNEQRNLIGEDDNNAPPVLKIYWANEKIRVHTKILKDTTASDEAILHTTAWTDSVREFSEVVGKNKFSLKIKATEARLEVSLNNSETFVYQDVHMRRWGIFENYFKAGNYFTSKEENTSATVKYYALEVKH